VNAAPAAGERPGVTTAHLCVVREAEGKKRQRALDRSRHLWRTHLAPGLAARRVRMAINLHLALVDWRPFRQR
jgi:hypothetical protein